MLCCSVIALLLGQCGALAGAARSFALGSIRLMTLGGVLAIQTAVAAVFFPTLHAADVARSLSWPVCDYVKSLTHKPL